MSKNLTKMSCLALMGLSLAACSNEEALLNEQSTMVAKKGITFVAEPFVGENGTRADYTFSVNPDGSNKASIAFNAEDKIGVWGMLDGEVEQVIFRLSDATTEGMSATFDGGLWRLREDETKYAAIYPYNKYIDEDEECNQYVCASYGNQWYEINGSMSDYDYMACDAVSVENGNAAFVMKHLGAIVRLKLSGLPANANVNTVRISLEEPAFLVNGWIKPGETISEIIPNYNAESQYDSQMVIDYDNVQADAEGIVYVYFMCAPVDLSGKTITVYSFIDDVPYKGTNSYTEKNITAGSYRVMSAVLSPAMDDVQTLELGENTIDHDAVSWCFTPEESGIYMMNEDVYFSNVDYTWLNENEVCRLEAGTKYFINWVSEETTSIVISKANMQRIIEGENTLDSDVAVCEFDCSKSGVYYFAENARFDDTQYFWDENDTPCFILEAGKNYLISEVSGSVLTLVLKEEISTINPLYEGEQMVEEGQWYELSVTESGWYDISIENGYSMNCATGLQELYNENKTFIQFKKHEDVESGMTFTLTKVDPNSLEILSVGTNEVTEDGYYKLNIEESGLYAFVYDYCNSTNYNRLVYLYKDQIYPITITKFDGGSATVKIGKASDVLERPTIEANTAYSLCKNRVYAIQLTAGTAYQLNIRGENNYEICIITDIYDYVSLYLSSQNPTTIEETGTYYFMLPDYSNDEVEISFDIIDN